MDLAVLTRLESFISNSETAGSTDFNLLYLFLGNGLTMAGEVESASVYYENLKVENLGSILRNNDIAFFLFYEMAVAVKGLAMAENFEQMHQLVRVLKNPVNRSSLYAFASAEILQVNPNDSLGFRMLDSAQVELSRITNLTSNQSNRILIAWALSLKDPEANSDEAYKMIKNIGNKFTPIQRICRAYAFHGNLFGATQQIIPNSSDSDIAAFLWNIIYASNFNSMSIGPEWEDYTKNYFFQYTRFLNLANEDI
jgi:hypothetical protein